MAIRTKHGYHINDKYIAAITSRLDTRLVCLCVGVSVSVHIYVIACLGLYFKRITQTQKGQSAKQQLEKMAKWGAMDKVAKPGLLLKLQPDCL